jgi:hypothetical protein
MIKYMIQHKLFYTYLITALYIYILTTTVYIYIIHVTLYECNDRQAVGGVYILLIMNAITTHGNIWDIEYTVSAAVWTNLFLLVLWKCSLIYISFLFHITTAHTNPHIHKFTKFSVNLCAIHRLFYYSGVTGLIIRWYKWNAKS